MESTKIKLKNVKVLFVNLTDTKYGKTVTIDVTEPTVRQEISDWVKTNKIGKGEAKFKEYKHEDGTVTMEYSFKLSDYTRVITAEDEEITLDQVNSTTGLLRGAVIDLVARSFEYDNNFGKGVSQSVVGIKIVEKGKSRVSEDLADLRN